MPEKVQRSAFCVQHSPPTVSFKTIGCRLNQAETDQIEIQFKEAGYLIVEAGGECDVAVINSCTITHGAERDSARWARRLRRQGAKTVVLAGCAVVHNGKNLKEQTGADIIANQTDKFRLLELLPEITSSVHPSEFSIQSSPPGSPHTRALVKAQDGCSFRCSYCIVPDTRGRPYSRPLQDVLDDIKRFADRGFLEVVITGANIGCYCDQKNRLTDLLTKAEDIRGIERIRIGSIESTTVEREVIDFMATSSKLCHFLHIPLQSGDDETLHKMRRHYTSSEYREVAEYAVELIPDIGLGTDIIVGFPGESDAAFQNSLNLVEDIPFSNLHVFSYSKRSGTPAADMPQQIDAAIKKERSAQLISLGKTKREAFAESFIGREVSVLIEKITEDGTACGWTEQYLPARISAAEAEVNTIVTFIPGGNDGDILK
jgi:threonylcarbamoyladenosine tRNA methylthiotransferase MtaB